LEMQIAGIVDCSHVTGMKPFVSAPSRVTRLCPVAWRNTWTTHDDFPAVREFHFVTWQQLSNGSMPPLEWMSHRDQGCGFSHAIALHNSKAEVQPKVLGLFLESCASRQKGPKLPTKTTVDFSKLPPTPQEVEVYRLEGRRSFSAFHPLPQRLEHARNEDDH